MEISQAAFVSVLNVEGSLHSTDFFYCSSIEMNGRFECGYIRSF